MWWMHLSKENVCTRYDLMDVLFINHTEKRHEPLCLL